MADIKFSSSQHADKRKAAVVGAKRILLIGCAMAASGCTASSPSATALRPTRGAAGATTLQIVWPCMNSIFTGPGPGKFKWTVYADDHPVGTVSACSHSTTTIAAAAQAIRIADPALDLAGLFGNKGQQFAMPRDRKLFLRVQTSPDGMNARLIDIDAARAAAEAKAIDSNR